MIEKSTRIKLLQEADVASVLLRLGIPTMLGMLISALYNAVDAYFVSGLGISQMGAVSVVFPIVQIVIGLGMMLGAGASSYISRLLGMGDFKKASQVASTTLFSSILVGSIIIGFILYFLDPILLALGATETILPYANAYAQIYVAGSIINVFTVTMNNLLIAQGATKFTMLTMLTGSVINIILDPILIYGMQLGIEGAAIATVISLAVNMFLYLGYIIKRVDMIKISFQYITFSLQIYSEVLKIGIPVLLFQLLASAAMGVQNTAARPFGDYAVAALGVVTRIMTVATYVVFGFLKGFQPFAGYHYGAGQWKRLQQAIQLCFKWTTAFCVVIGLILIFFARPIVSQFGTDVAMIQLATTALQANALLFMTFGFQMVYASLYLAMGNSAIGSLLSLSRQGIFFFPLILLLPYCWGLTGVILVQPFADFFTTVFTIIFAVKIKQRLTTAETVLLQEVQK